MDNTVLFSPRHDLTLAGMAAARIAGQYQLRAERWRVGLFGGRSAGGRTRDVVVSCLSATPWMRRSTLPASIIPPKSLATMASICGRVFVFLVLLSTIVFYQAGQFPDICVGPDAHVGSVFGCSMSTNTSTNPTSDTPRP